MGTQWRTCPFVPGQVWPSGSMGSPQSRHEGRPAWTRLRARSTKAAACGRVRRKRALAVSGGSLGSGGSHRLCRRPRGAGPFFRGRLLGFVGFVVVVLLLLRFLR